MSNLDSRLGDCVAMTLKCKFVILNPSLRVILSAAKNLVVQLRTGSAKNLIRSVCYKRLGPQNDLATQPLRGNDAEGPEKGNLQSNIYGKNS